MPKRVGILYWTHFGHTLFTDRNTCPSTGDIWVMRGQQPSYEADRPNFWGKPLWAETNGDHTIKNNYRTYFGGGDRPIVPNRALLDRHAELLVDAGIDFVIVELTNGVADFDPNGPSCLSGTHALLTHWAERVASGLKTPQVTFWITAAVEQPGSLAALEQQYFGRYPEALFTKHLGKMLLLCSPPGDDQGRITISYAPRYAGGILTELPFDRYTARFMWSEGGGRIWTSKLANCVVPPSPFYFEGRPEQVCAPVAWGYTYGGLLPGPGATGRQNGAYFAQFMKAACDYGPEILVIYGWNEWTSGNRGTRESPVFDDQWDFEYSSDIEPVAGGVATAPIRADTAWYDLMKAQVTQFKDSGTVMPTPPGPGTYAIIVQHSQLALDLLPGTGDQVCQAVRSAASSQMWSVDAHPVYSQNVRLRPATRPDVCLGVTGGSRDSTAFATLAPCNGTMAEA